MGKYIAYIWFWLNCNYWCFKYPLASLNSQYICYWTFRFCFRLRSSLHKILFTKKDVPHFTVISVLSVLDVSVNVLCVFFYPVISKMCQNVIRTMIIHHVIVKSMFCDKVLAFVTCSTFAVTRFNWAERADTVWKEDIFFKSLVTVMRSMFQSVVVLNHVLCDGFKSAQIALERNILWGCQRILSNIWVTGQCLDICFLGFDIFSPW